MQQVYQVVQKTYPSVSWLEVMLDKAMTEAERILPYSKPANFYTLMTGTFAYYDRVICTDSFMAINIDQYSIKNMKLWKNEPGRKACLLRKQEENFDMKHSERL